MRCDWSVWAKVDFTKGDGFVNDDLCGPDSIPIADGPAATVKLVAGCQTHSSLLNHEVLALDLAESVVNGAYE
jgi:hypothetical protein